MPSAPAVVRAMFRTLWRLWGAQHWWPAESQLEVIVGAYLTQNTAWTNVERALANLRDARALSLDALREIPLARLEELIRPSGYFRQKAERLKRFVAFLDERYGGSLERMFAEPTSKLRQELLALNGVGPETADSILLYSGGHEVFVVDAYTRRVLERHALLPAQATYEEIRALFEKALSPVQAVRLMQRAASNEQRDPRNQQPTDNDQQLATSRKQRANLADSRPCVADQETINEKPEAFEPETALYGAAHAPSAASEMPRSRRAQILNEMHAQIVGIGKNYCLKTAPLCEVCPLKKYLPR